MDCLTFEHANGSLPLKWPPLDLREKLAAVDTVDQVSSSLMQYVPWQRTYYSSPYKP